MATPQMIPQQVQLNLFDGSPASIRINTFNPDGSVLDVHTGYTLQSFVAAPAANPNGLAPMVDLSADCSKAFDATGVTLSITDAQAATIAAALPSLSSSCYMFLSNDGGTTGSLAAKGVISIDPLSVLA